MVSQVISIVYTTEVYAVEIGAAAETEVASASTILALQWFTHIAISTAHS